MAGQVTPKERMLKSIRKGLIEKKENIYPELDITPLYKDSHREIEVMFAEELTRVNGQFFYCDSRLNLIEGLVDLAEKMGWKNIFASEASIKNLLEEFEFPYSSDVSKLQEADVGITCCESLIARNGSILISTGMNSGRQLMIYPPAHVVFADASQLVPDIKDGLIMLKNKYQSKIPSSITLVTGPSRTADIEKTLVLGAHGPKELYVFYLDGEESILS